MRHDHVCLILSKCIIALGRLACSLVYGIQRNFVNVSPAILHGVKGGVVLCKVPYRDKQSIRV